MGKKDDDGKKSSESKKHDPCKPCTNEDLCKKTTPFKAELPSQIEEKTKPPVLTKTPLEEESSLAKKVSGEHVPTRGLGGMSPQELWKSLQEFNPQKLVDILKNKSKDFIPLLKNKSKELISPDNLKLQLKKVNKKNLICLVKCGKKYVKEFGMADKAVSSGGRPMKFPYTFSAKFAQFPLRHYFNNQWIWKYYLVSVAVCIPVFYSINKLANSPGNVAKWAEIRRKEALEHHH